MIFDKTGIVTSDTHLVARTAAHCPPVLVPDYLEKTYWWAYTQDRKSVV